MDRPPRRPRSTAGRRTQSSRTPFPRLPFRFGILRCTARRCHGIPLPQPFGCSQIRDSCSTKREVHRTPSDNPARVGVAPGPGGVAVLVMSMGVQAVTR